jgi:integrase
MPRPRKPAEQTTPSIYRGADGSWHARVTRERRPDGKIQRKHVQRRTKAELREAVRELERSRDTGGYVWTTDDLTLEAWLEHWLEAVLPITARWKTLSTYRSQMRLHVLPALGAWRLSEIECDRRVGGGLLLVEPKTKASERTIVLPAPLVEELRAHRAQVNRRRLAAGQAWDATHDLVFPAANGGLSDPAKDHAEWKALLKQADLRDVRLHDARHTAATLLLVQGVDIRTVMSIMGWTEMATAQRYTHAVDELRRRAARQMGALLWDQHANP